MLTLSKAYSLSADSRVLTKSHIALENIAMAFRSVNGDITLMKNFLNVNLISQNKLEIWYDRDFNIVSVNEGIYCIKIETTSSQNNVIDAKITIYKPKGEIIDQLLLSQYKPIE